MVPCFVTGCCPVPEFGAFRRVAARPSGNPGPSAHASRNPGPSRPNAPERRRFRDGRARNPAILGPPYRAAPETRRFSDAPLAQRRKPGDSGTRPACRRCPRAVPRPRDAPRARGSPGGRRRRVCGLDRVITPVLARQARGRARPPATVPPSLRRGPTSDQPRARRCRAGSAAHPDGRRAGRAASRPGQTSLRARGACWRETPPT